MPRYKGKITGKGTKQTGLRSCIEAEEIGVEVDITHVTSLGDVVKVALTRGAYGGARFVLGEFIVDSKSGKWIDVRERASTAQRRPARPGVAFMS